jgi:hypothetical protein
MYVKMMLDGQVIDQRKVLGTSLYTGDFLQTTIQEMMEAHEAQIESSGEQPQFVVEEKPTRKPKEKMIPAVFSKLAFLQKIFS